MWHLLSLDAPCVAVLWTYFFAYDIKLPHLPELLLAMFLAVWMLYAADRLLDARNASSDLEERHRFHARHRKAFSVMLLAAAACLLPLLGALPQRLLLSYLALAALLLGWFAVIHGVGRRRHDALPKNLMVAVFFAAATVLPAWCAATRVHVSLLISALLFGGCCLLNCLLLECWEQAKPSRTARATALLLLLACAVCAALRPGCRLPALCVAASVGLLLLLHLQRARLQSITLRAAADAALLTPAVLLLAKLLPR